LLTQSGYQTEFNSQLWSNIRVTQDLGAILRGLSATAMFSFDDYNSHTVKRTKSPTTYLANGRDAAGNLTFEDQPTNIGSGYLGYDNGTNAATRQYYDEVALNYNNSFGKNNVTGLVLFNQQDKEDPFAKDFISAIPFRYMGLAGRVTYAYNNKYLAEANFGYNGSETFAPGHRFGFFPAFGAGWVISKEKFFEPLADVFPLVKLRYSYGVVGNSNIGGRRVAYISTVGGGNGKYSYGQNGTNQTIDGYDIGDYAVNVTWEKAKKQDLGIELALLNNSISLTVDAFQENRTGIFRQRGDVPSYVGLLSLPYANLGEIHNRGIDATLELNKRLDQNWQLGFKGTFTFNKAININDANPPWRYPWQQRIGQPYGKRFGYTALGLFKSDADVANSPHQNGINKAGDIKYKDLNGDGKIDSYDVGPIGYGSIPSIVYGFGPTINYKGFALAGWFKGISSVDISLNGDGLQPFSQGGERGNLLAEITDRWTPTNTNPNPLYPRLTYGNQNMNYENSTWWVKNGAFMRLQTLEFSYDFAGAKWLKSAGMSHFSIYFIGYNLWTLSGFKLWDVELGDGNGAQYPLTKTYNLGVKCTFR
jgi:TonB-linked SusC/RagA family outer membrane protein